MVGMIRVSPSTRTATCALETGISGQYIPVLQSEVLPSLFKTSIQLSAQYPTVSAKVGAQLGAVNGVWEWAPFSRNTTMCVSDRFLWTRILKS